MTFEIETLNCSNVLTAIRTGTAKRHEQLLSWRDKLRKTLNNWFRLRGKRRYAAKSIAVSR
jgi:hypothetical protein